MNRMFCKTIVAWKGSDPGGTPALPKIYCIFTAVMKPANHQKRILIVAATALEMAPMIRDLPDRVAPQPGDIVSRPEADILITGPGIASTVYHTTKVLQANQYALLINAGVAGSYNPELVPGTVCLVTRDRFADFGAESPQGFIGGEHFPYTNLTQKPYSNGWLEPLIPLPNAGSDLSQATAITSDTLHTTTDSIRSIVGRWNPDLESMEGAAFFFVCMQSGIPCLQIRSVSNMVGPRDSTLWSLDLAILSLHQSLNQLIRRYE
jgi:futalosine hydrolase